MKHSGKVLIEKEADKSTRTAESIRRNPHAVANVNQPQGPRHGNEGAHAAKRGNFKDAKEERAPLADMVMQAFGTRDDLLEANGGDHEVPGSGGIDSNSQIRRFARSKRK